MFKNAFLGALFAALFATSVSAATISAQDAGMSNTAGQSGQTIYTGTPSANASVGSSTQGATPGMVTITLTGTWSGTLQLLATSDGVHYVPWLCSVRGVSGTAITSATSNGTFDCPGGGVTNWLVLASAWTSGSAVVTPFASFHELNSGVAGGGGGGGGAVTVASGADATEGATNATAWDGVTANTTVLGALKALWAAITSPLADCANSPCTHVIGNVGIDSTSGHNTVLTGSGSLTGPQAGATVGATPYGLQTAATTNSTLVSTGQHTIYGLHLASTSLTVMYLRMYDSVGAPTCSSSTGFIRTFAIPPAASAGLVGGWEVDVPTVGIQVSNGIGFCVTGGPTSTDNTNAFTGGEVNMDYK